VIDTATTEQISDLQRHHHIAARRSERYSRPLVP